MVEAEEEKELTAEFNSKNYLQNLVNQYARNN